VDYTTDLPSNISEYKPIVEVGEISKPTYWIGYTDGRWVETIKPYIKTKINPRLMPHTIKREFNELNNRFEFNVEQFSWDDRLVGDDDSNPFPTFIDDNIRDLLFFKNRLALVTESNIILSEVGEYGNFFRTTAAALLDSDRIDAGVESTSSVSIKHAILMEDSIMLFSDKAQFRFRGGNILSPNSYELMQETAYDFNDSIKPIFMNNRLYFLSNRGEYTAAFEMSISNNSTVNSVANDLSAHCQSYIDNNIGYLSGSAVNNMLFLNSIEHRDTVFIYKYYDTGNQRYQSAWFKWSIDGDFIISVATRDRLYSMTQRGPRHQLEAIEIFPSNQDRIKLDNDMFPINSRIDLGEWIYGTDGDRNTRGTLQLRTIEIESSGELAIEVKDLQRGNLRVIPSKYATRDKVMMYGNSKDVRCAIINDGTTGFRIDVVSFEGTITRRQQTR
jgi:hypothetical protein